MINKSVFEDDLIKGMQKQLTANDQSNALDRLDEAVDCLNSASEILEDVGFNAQADKIIAVLNKLATSLQDPRKISDKHTKGLTPDKMVKNLLHHGTEFNMSDDGSTSTLDDNDVDDLLNLDIDGLEEGSEESEEMDFEDEI
jgi:hypothetical protein